MARPRNSHFRLRQCWSRSRWPWAAFGRQDIGNRSGCDLLGPPQEQHSASSTLVTNAIRHTPEGGIILVSAEPAEDGDGVTLHGSDTGSGIPEEHLPHVFDRFYRADPSRTQGRGSGAGLGLAIARSLVERMDGTISVESDPGEGASFTIRLRQVGGQ